jgi:branched-chain amino acid transport system permease protein
MAPRPSSPPLAGPVVRPVVVSRWSRPATAATVTSAGALACAVAAVPVFALLRPLTGGYLAVATWVVAECLFLYVTNQLWPGGGTGVSLSGQLSSMPPVLRQAYTNWAALALMVVVVAGVYLLAAVGFGVVDGGMHI